MNPKQTFFADLNQLRPMIRWIRQEAILLGLDETSVRQTELASEEALVNIIDHGYKGTVGQITIELQDSGSHIEIVIRDKSPFFNPLEHAIEFDPLATLEERQIGGLGILFIRQYMDEVHYQREGEANVLTLIKKKSA